MSLSPILSHRIHVWYIYQHLVDFKGKCRQIFHTWILCWLSQWLTFQTFGDSIFSRKNKVQMFFSWPFGWVMGMERMGVDRLDHTYLWMIWWLRVAQDANAHHQDDTTSKVYVDVRCIYIYVNNTYLYIFFNNNILLHGFWKVYHLYE